MNIKKQFDLKSVVLTENESQQSESLQFTILNLLEVEEAINYLEDLHTELKHSYTYLKKYKN